MKLAIDFTSKKDGEDICYLCEDCEKYNQCEYYHDRKPTSYICKFFKVKEDVGKWICIGYKTEKDWINGVKSYKCPFCNEEGDWISPYCPNCGKKLEKEEEDGSSN